MSLYVENFALLYRLTIRIQYFRQKCFINKLLQPRQMDKFFRDVKQLLATRNFPCNLNFVFCKLFTQILCRAIVSSTRVMSEESEKIYINLVLQNFPIQNILSQNGK